jgi:hypothetical protein
MSNSIVFKTHSKKRFIHALSSCWKYFFYNKKTNHQHIWRKWERYAKGKTIVSIDESQTEFNSVGKTGGSKYLQSHFIYELGRRAYSIKLNREKLLLSVDGYGS